MSDGKIMALCAVAAIVLLSMLVHHDMQVANRIREREWIKAKAEVEHDLRWHFAEPEHKRDQERNRRVREAYRIRQWLECGGEIV